jgi:hypothetical protein
MDTKILIAILCFLTILAFRIWKDFGLWKRGIEPSHGRNAVITAVALMASSGVLMTLASSAAWWLSFILASGVLFFAFWTGFDGGYNLTRRWHLIKRYGRDGLGKPPKYGFWFAGSEDGKKDAGLDNIMQALPVWGRAALKLGGLGVFLFFYIKNL